MIFTAKNKTYYMCYSGAGILEKPKKLRLFSHKKKA